MHLIARSDIGMIHVRDNDGARELLIGNQVQGGCHLAPTAASVEPTLTGPGPIPSSRYQAGWLIAGADTPSGQALMLGLGSGSGAIALLSEFPELTLIVVERDPVIVQCALQGFPLLDHYQNLGRLHIVESCAWAYLESVTEDFSMILVDLYLGSNASAHNKELYKLCVARTDKVWVNHIGARDDELTALLDNFDEAGQPVAWMFQCAESWDTPGPRNIIVTTSPVDVSAVDSYVPYARNIVVSSATAARSWYNDLLRSALTTA